MPTEPQQNNRSSQIADLEEQQLVELAKNDPLALSVLYRQHYSAIYSYVYRRIGNTHDTNDVVAEIFVSMIRYLPRFRWSGAPFRCWLLKLSTTQINRWIRKKKWTSLWHSFDASHHCITNPSDVLEERLEPVRQALLALPLAFQTVLTLHYFEDLSVDSIAQIINCRPGTVKSRLSRGRELLRKKLSTREEMTSNEQRTIGIVPK